MKARTLCGTIFAAVAFGAVGAADAGVGGFIWCQSNDAIDLLTREEKKDFVGTGPCGSEGLVGISSLSWRMLT